MTPPLAGDRAVKENFCAQQCADRFGAKVPTNFALTSYAVISVSWAIARKRQLSFQHFDSHYPSLSRSRPLIEKFFFIFL